MNITLILMLGFGIVSCSELIVYGAAGPFRSDYRRPTREEALRSRRQQYGRESVGAAEDKELQEVLRLSREEYKKEQEKRRRESGRQEAEMKIALEKALEEQRHPVAVLPAPADSVVLMYNANVPIEHVELIDAYGSVRVGMPRSPSSNLLDQSVWGVLAQQRNWPFTLSIEANNRIYRWRIESIGEGYGAELALIQKKVPRGFNLELYQIDETDTYIYEQRIPLTTEIPLPQK